MTDDPVWSAVRQALEAERRPAFASGFADRTTARWRRERASGPTDLLLRFGRRMLLAGAAAALLLATYTLRGGHRVDGQSTVEALLGLSPVTLDVAYLGTLPGAE